MNAYEKHYGVSPASFAKGEGAVKGGTERQWRWEAAVPARGKAQAVQGGAARSAGGRGRRALDPGRRGGMIVCLLALSALLFSGCAGGTAGKTDGAGSAPEAPEDAPAESSSAQITFEGTDVDGNAVSSSVFSQSKLTMVNVWATYCGPCLNEMPELGELAAEYDTEEFQIIGVISDVLEDADPEAAKSLIEQTGADYTHLLLNESIYNALLQDVTAVPTTFFIDENGEVLDTVIGAMDKTAWEETIHALLEER